MVHVVFAEVVLFTCANDAVNVVLYINEDIEATTRINIIFLCRMCINTLKVSRIIYLIQW